MKIKYEFATDNVEIEVSEEWATVLAEEDRLEYNNNHAEKRRHCSLEAYNLDNALLPSDVDVVAELLRKEDTRSLEDALTKLSPRQKYLLEEAFYKNRSYADIGRELGITRCSVAQAVERALKQMKKFL